MSDLIISVSGLRGIVGESLTTDIARRYAQAFAAGLPNGTVVITRDGRGNGTQLVEPIVAGLMSAGVANVLDGGVAATPTTGVLVRQHEAVGGIQISASHNSAPYNGMKLFSAAGRVIPSDAGQEVLERFQGGESAHTSQTAGPTSTITDTTTAHWHLLQQAVDVKQLRERRLRVLLDANHGAGSILGRRLLEEFGCEVTLLGGRPNGMFSHPPEPTAENLTSVLERVVQSKSEIGFCQDPDADRLAIIDENGHYLGEEYTLALCVDHLLHRLRGPVVTNCSTSRMTEELAKKHGVPFFRSAVGEANVVDKMLEVGAVIGGEGNGGVIDPRVGLVRDSFIGMALVLTAMVERSLPISALADELPRYAICKTKVPVPREHVAAALAALQDHFAEAQADRLDGLRLDWPDRWLLVRASNTEPIVRAIAEATFEHEAQQLCDTAAAVLGEAIGAMRETN